MTTADRLPGRTHDASHELPYALSVRLSMDQRLFLQMVAEANDVKVSTALRLVIDEAIAAVVEDQRAADGTRRDTFGIVSSFTPDPAWEARHGGEE